MHFRARPYWHFLTGTDGRDDRRITRHDLFRYAVKANDVLDDQVPDILRSARLLRGVQVGALGEPVHNDQDCIGSPRRSW
jgi:hypothetical protein